MNDTLQTPGPVSEDAQSMSSHCAARLGIDDKRAKLEDALHTRLDQLRELRGTTMNRASEAMRAANTTVHQHPYSALAAVAVTGLLVGFLAGRR